MHTSSSLFCQRTGDGGHGIVLAPEMFIHHFDSSITNAVRLLKMLRLMRLMRLAKIVLIVDAIVNRINSVAAMLMVQMTRNNV